MIKLPDSLNTWGTPAFNDTLKREIAQFSAEQLPLQQGLSNGSYAKDDNLSVIILGVTEDSDTIQVKAGIAYTSIIAGCNCADDPAPVNEENEYCEVQFDINKATADTTVKLLRE